MLEKTAKIFGYFIIIISISAGIFSIINKDYKLLILQILALLAGGFLVYVLKDIKIIKKSNNNDIE